MVNHSVSFADSVQLRLGHARVLTVHPRAAHFVRYLTQGSLLYGKSVAISEIERIAWK